MAKPLVAVKKAAFPRVSLPINFRYDDKKCDSILHAEECFSEFKGQMSELMN